MWHRFMAAAALALLAAGIQPARAQDKQPNLEELTRFREIKAGDKLIQVAAAAETDLNKAAIKKMALWRVARLMDAARNSQGSSDVYPISRAVTDFTSDVLDTSAHVAKLKLSQLDLIQLYGKEFMAGLQPILKFKEPYSAEKTLLMINAGRCVAALGKSGYEPLADDCVAIIDNPAISDAIKFYYLQALKNLFAAPNAEAPEKSVFNDKQRELKAIKSLIAFATRKPTLSPNSPQDEID